MSTYLQDEVFRVQELGLIRFCVVIGAVFVLCLVLGIIGIEEYSYNAMAKQGLCYVKKDVTNSTPVWEYEKCK